ncbi:MAG TPA: hypothetical protein VFQ30_01970 [Ktedonobacteraceae bacterium]|nr:hypothetical protein [Ktedonobacteraceae bacterium]
MLYRGFPLHPDDDNDPYIFRVDLSTFGFGIGTGRVIFSREHEVGTTAVHCEFGPLSFQKRPASKNPCLWAAGALGALAVGAAMTVVRRSRDRSHREG